MTQPSGRKDEPANRADAPEEAAVEETAEQLSKADAIIVGSPVYFGGVTAQLKALIDRTAALYQRSALRGKIGAAMSCGGGRHGGQEMTVNQIITFFLMHEMTVACADEGVFGAMGVASDIGEIESDEDAMSSARAIARRIAEMLAACGG